MPACPSNVEQLHHGSAVNHPRDRLRDEVNQLVVYVLGSFVLRKDLKLNVHHVGVKCQKSCNHSNGQYRQVEHSHPEDEKSVMHVESQIELWSLHHELCIQLAHFWNVGLAVSVLNLKHAALAA